MQTFFTLKILHACIYVYNFRPTPEPIPETLEQGPEDEPVAEQGVVAVSEPKAEAAGKTVLSVCIGSLLWSLSFFALS